MSNYNVDNVMEPKKNCHFGFMLQFQYTPLLMY